MADLRELLEELVTVQGIGTAVVVGRDGFVIEGVSPGGQIDTDAVGAVISTGIGSSEVMGRELEVGDMTQAMFEYNEGMIVLALLGYESLEALVSAAVPEAIRDTDPLSLPPGRGEAETQQPHRRRLGGKTYSV